MGEKVRTRFAPSPTGFLHLGGARTALFNWALARKEGGTFVLRIEDTDPIRSNKDFEQAIYEDLAWLGIDWDEGPDRGGPSGPYRQSERLKLYRQFFERLKARGHVYPCYCTREDLKEERKKALSEGHPPRYSRRCLSLSPEEQRALEREGRCPSWRFHIPSGRTVVFHDLIRGPMSFAAGVLTDFVIVRADGLPTYNFACVVDDALMGITHVLRGEEHLPNTPYQILLYEALGVSPPLFAHVPLILAEDGTKLSKRRGDTSIRFFREEGFLPAALFNYLFTLGHSFPEGKEVLPRGELVALFDLGRVRRSNAIFDPARLSWMNRVYLRGLAPEDLEREFILFAGSAWREWEKDLGRERLLKLLVLFREEATNLKDLALSLSQSLREVSISLDSEGVRLLTLFHSAFSVIPEDSWEDETKIREELRRLQKESNVPPRTFYRVLRVVLLGREEGTELHRLLGALGRKKVLAKIEKTLTRVGSGYGDSAVQHAHP